MIEIKDKRPVLKGTRITISQIVAEFACGRSIDDLSEDMDLNRDDLADLMFELSKLVRDRKLFAEFPIYDFEGDTLVQIGESYKHKVGKEDLEKILSSMEELTEFSADDVVNDCNNITKFKVHPVVGALKYVGAIDDVCRGVYKINKNPYEALDEI